MGIHRAPRFDSACFSSKGRRPRILIGGFEKRKKEYARKKRKKSAANPVIVVDEALCMKALRKWSIGILLALLLLPASFFCLLYGREVRQQRLDRALIQAIKKEDTLTAIDLLNQGADANVTDKPFRQITLKSFLTDLWNRLRGKKPLQSQEFYTPALLLAYGPVTFGIPDTSLVMMLNESDNSSEWNDWTKKSRNTPLISALIQQGAALNTKERVGNTLLNYACMCDDAKTIKLLLEHHVDPNVKSDLGLSAYPPLMCTEDYDCARLLLEHGAKVNTRDSSGRTRLMFIENTKLYPLLLQYHADPNAQDSDGKTALIHLFVSLYLPESNIRTGVRFLLPHGAKVSLKDKEGHTALDYGRAGKANWMAGEIGGKHDKAILDMMERALKRERTQTAH